jgi:hypothetical protein
VWYSLSFFAGCLDLKICGLAIYLPVSVSVVKTVSLRGVPVPVDLWPWLVKDIEFYPIGWLYFYYEELILLIVYL